MRIGIYNPLAIAENRQMGDKSPKANQKKTSQKESKQSSTSKNKSNAQAAKQVAGQAKKK